MTGGTSLRGREGATRTWSLGALGVKTSSSTDMLRVLLASASCVRLLPEQAQLSMRFFGGDYETYNAWVRILSWMEQEEAAEEAAERQHTASQVRAYKLGMYPCIAV